MKYLKVLTIENICDIKRDITLIQLISQSLFVEEHSIVQMSQLNTGALTC